MRIIKDITKGDYTFILNWETGADTTKIKIPDYPIQFNLSGIDSGVNEGGKEVIDLEGRLKDPNPEGNPVFLSNARTLDGKTSVSVNGYELTINAMDNVSRDEKYVVELEATSYDKETTTTTALEGKIYDLFDFSGWLEDSELHQRQQGVVEVYSFPDSMLIGQTRTNIAGDFNERTNKRISDLGDYVLVRARIEDQAGQQKSYVRTIKHNAEEKGDLTNKLIRAVPYEGLYPLSQHGVTPEDFRRHAAEVLSTDTGYEPPSDDPVNRNRIIPKWDFGEAPNASSSFKYVVISKTQRPHDNPYDPEPPESHFNQEQAD